jgi:WS/DGAT/MGAT family acyltransferase
MGALDSYMYYSELPDAMTHTVKLGILDPATQPGGCSIDWLRDVIARLLPGLGPLHQVVCPTPFALNHPLLVEPGAVDLEHHVRRIGIPSPGSLAEMCETVSHLVEHQLPRDKPLWQVWMLDGLSDGRIGVLLILHHAIADGTAAKELISRLFLPDSGGVPATAAPLPWEEFPSWTRRLALGLIELPGVFLRGVPPLLRARREKKRWLATIGADIDKYASPDKAPKTLFNAVLNPRRTYSACSLPLTALAPVRAAHEVTINDIVLTLVAAAARRYLAEYEQIPNRPLVGSMPFTYRSDGIKNEIFGNDSAVDFVWLHVEIEDPVQRLLATRAAANDTKEHFEHTREMTASKAFGAFPPFLWKLAPRIARMLKGPPSLFGNILVSNVRGPDQPLWLDEARVDEFYSIGHIAHGGALNMTVWSYAGELRLSIYACPAVVPAAEKLGGYFCDALDELLAAVEAAPANNTGSENPKPSSSD